MFSGNLLKSYKGIEAMANFRSILTVTFLFLRLAVVAEGQPDLSSRPTIVDPSHPQDSRGETVYRMQGKQTDFPVVPGFLIPPKVIKTVEPKYPKSLTKPHAIADTIVEGVVAVNGDFIDVRTINQVDPDISKSLLDAASKFRFKPATLDGKPVAVPLRIDLHFK
jgi:Gram-negative bacterial TonB protein C-terminal